MRLLALIDFAAAMQGFLLAYLLVRRHPGSLAHRLLAALVCAMSIVLLGAVLGLSGQYRVWPHLIRVADPFVLLFGPLLYFHVHAAVRGGMPRLPVLHLLPVAAYLLYAVPFYLRPPEEKIALMEIVMGTRLHPLLTTLLIVRIAHMLFYSVWSLVLLRRFQSGLRDRFSHVAERDLHRSAWALMGYIVVTLGMLAIVVVAIFFHVDLITANGFFGLLLGICVYALAYSSWPRSAPLPEVAPEGERPQPASAATSRAGRSVFHLSDEQCQALSARLVGTLEGEKAFLDGDLSLAQLSERMNVPSYQVSEVINRHYRSNFFDAVNRLRVEEVKQRLVDPAHAAYSIVGIAMDSGFNSKSSFNTAFKKYTGTTPSRFRMN